MNARKLRRRHYQRMWFTVQDHRAVNELIEMFGQYTERVSTFSAAEVFDMLYPPQQLYVARVDEAHDQG